MSVARGGISVFTDCSFTGCSVEREASGDEPIGLNGVNQVRIAIMPIIIVAMPASIPIVFTQLDSLFELILKLQQD